MRNHILHIIAKMLGVLIHIEGLPYGRAPKSVGDEGCAQASGKTG